MKDIYGHKVDFLLSQCCKPSFHDAILHALPKQYMEKKTTGKVMFADEKKGAILPAFYFYKRFCNTTEFTSKQDKVNPLFLMSPLVISRGNSAGKNSLLTMKYILPLSSGSTKTQKFGSKKDLEGKQRELGFAYSWGGKIRTSSAGSPYIVLPMLSGRLSNCRIFFILLTGMGKKRKPYQQDS